MHIFVLSLQRRVRFLAFIAFLTLLALVFGAACSSDAGSGEPTGEASDGTSEAVASGGSDDDGMLPIGTAWEATVLGRFEGQGDIREVKAAGDSLWVIGRQFNIPMLWRSDDGATWK